MKLLIKISVEEAFDLIKYFNQNENPNMSEKVFQKTVDSDEFNEYLQSKLTSTEDKVNKAKLGVKNILSIASGYPISHITSEKTLKINLKISPNVFNRLHRPLNKLLKRLQSGKIIKSSDVAKCKKVKDCEDLVIKKL